MKMQLIPVFAPVLLAPIGDYWLIESRAEFSGEFLPHNGSVSGQLEKEVDYAQPRFLTPFGIYNERLYPIWIRKLENVPIIFPIGTGSSDGVMLRGGFPVSSKAHLNSSHFQYDKSPDTGASRGFNPCP